MALTKVHNRIISGEDNDNVVYGPDSGTALTTPLIAGQNTMIGKSAGENTTVSRDNTFVGFEAGKDHITDTNGYGGNTAVGANCFDNNTTGYQNTAVGNTALNDNVTGDFNTAVGWGALQKNLLSNNTAVGILAMGAGNNQDDTCAFGMFALANNEATTTKNTSVGYASAMNFGRSSLGGVGGDGNTWIGVQSGGASLDGSRNTMIGGASGFHSATTDMTGDDNTFLGYKSGDLNIITGSRNTIIGAYADTPSGDDSDTVVIAAGGSAGVTKTRFYSPADGSVTIGKMASTGRIYQKMSETVTALGGAASAVVVQVNVPSGAKLLGVQVKIDVDVVENWDCAYSGGASQTIATNQSNAAGTTVSKFFDTNAATPIASSEVDVTFSPNGGGNFTGTGTFRAVAYYQAFVDMT